MIFGRFYAIIQNTNNLIFHGGVSVSTVHGLESISIPQTVAALKYGKFLKLNANNNYAFAA